MSRNVVVLFFGARVGSGFCSQSTPAVKSNAWRAGRVWGDAWLPRLSRFPEKSSSSRNIEARDGVFGSQRGYGSALPAFGSGIVDAVRAGGRCLCTSSRGSAAMFAAPAVASAAHQPLKIILLALLYEALVAGVAAASGSCRSRRLRGSRPLLVASVWLAPLFYWRALARRGSCRSQPRRPSWRPRSSEISHGTRRRTSLEAGNDFY